MSSSVSEGYDTILDWLGKQQQERAALDAENTRLQQEVQELRAELAALASGKGVHVVINGAPFYLTSEPPSHAVAIHVVPDLNTTSTPYKDSFLLSRDTDEHEAIFSTEKTA